MLFRQIYAQQRLHSHLVGTVAKRLTTVENSFYLHISQSGDHRISNKGRELVLAEHHDNASTLPTTLSVVVATLSGFCLTIRCLLAQVEAGSFTETVDGDWIADSDEIANHTAAVE